MGEVWTYAYNAAGHPVSMTSPLGHTVRYSTDAFGRVTQKTDALGNETNYSYQYEVTGLTVGLVIRQSDALSHTTTYRYNSRSQLLSVVTPTGNTQTLSYDNQGRLTHATDAAGNVTQLQYGSWGSALDGMVVAAVYPTYRETYQYNAMGMPTQVTQILGEQEQLTSRVSYDAEGQTVSVTDSAGRTSQKEYDALGNAIKQMDPLGGETQQTFNVQGNVTSVADALGNTHRFEYDANGNQIKEITPSGQETKFVYNAANRLTQKTDATGNITTYQYDGAGRVTHIAYTAAGQSTPEQTIGYTYNAADQLVEVVQKDANGNVQTRHVYTLDALGRITRENITYGYGVNAFTQTLGYSYDADGNTSAITYPDGKTQTYAYEHGRIKAVQLPNGQSITWDGYQWKRPTQVTAPGGTQTLSYDALQRSQGIEVKANQGAVNGTTLMNRGYTYDAAGNITKRQTEEGAYTYGYDLMDRITQVTPPASVQNTLPVEAYAYDAVHNRIGSAQQPGDWQYNADNQLLQFGTGADQTTYTYTANGHVATQTKNGQLLTYTYDATDRLASIHNGTVTSGTEVARYAYDAMGRRISKTVNDETTYYLYADEGLIAELDDQGNMQVAYGWQADAMFGTAPLWQAQVNNGNLQTAQYHFLYTDHLGTPQLAVSANGQTSWRAQSEVFGKTTPDAQNLITMNLRFPGQYFDQETNTHYNYFRDYNPQTGRYTQRDPIGLAGGSNIYTYSANMPTLLIDNYGLSPRDVERLTDAINKCIQEMTEKGLRVDNTWTNNRAGSGRLDCGEQTEYVMTNCIEPLITELYDDPLDADWVVRTRSGWKHIWGMLRSSDIKDPVIWFDPRSNQISYGQPCSTCSSIFKWIDRFGFAEERSVFDITYYYRDPNRPKEGNRIRDENGNFVTVEIPGYRVN